MSPSLSGGVAWTEGEFVTQLLDVSLLSFPDTSNNVWGVMIWEEENTDDATQAYVEVDILDSTGATVADNVTVSGSTGQKSIDLNDYSIRASDCYVKFKLFAKTKSPVVRNIQLVGRDSW